MIPEIERIEGIELKLGTNLSKYTTIRLSCIGDIAMVSTVEALASLLPVLVEKGINYQVLGWGANQVISKTSNTLFIKLRFHFNRELLSEPRSLYHLPASAPLNALQSHAQKFGLSGWEVFTGVPASLGGAIYMNAGTALGEIGEIVKSVELMRPDGSIRVEKIVDKSFSYRKNHFVKKGEVIIAASLCHRGIDPGISEKIKTYMEFRKRSQPLKSFNCGCVWKNFDENHKAGLFVDKSGLNNLISGKMEVSDIHSNFYENKGGANYEDFESLTELLREQLLLHTGIRFELEAKIY